jgi:hypothetical protein
MTLKSVASKVAKAGWHAVAAAGTRGVVAAYWGTVYLLSGRPRSAQSTEDAEAPSKHGPSEHK